MNRVNKTERTTKTSINCTQLYLAAQCNAVKPLWSHAFGSAPSKIWRFAARATCFCFFLSPHAPYAINERLVESPVLWLDDRDRDFACALLLLVCSIIFSGALSCGEPGFLANLGGGSRIQQYFWSDHFTGKATIFKKCKTKTDLMKFFRPQFFFPSSSKNC